MSQLHESAGAAAMYKYQIDPGYDPDGEVPGSAVIGAQPVDSEGNNAGEFERNPGYKPSPVAIMLEKLPTDPVAQLLAVQRQGRVSRQEFLDLLAGMTFEAIARKGGGELFVFPDGDQNAIELYSAPEFRPEVGDDLEFTSLTGADALRLLSTGINLQINPDSSGTYQLSSELLATE